MTLRTLTATLAILLCSWGAQAQSLPTPPPRFEASFFQPLSGHGAWPQERWERMFDDLSALGVKELVVQWSANGKVRFFRQGDCGADCVPLLENLLSLAQARGMTLRLGLTHQEDWWSKITRSPEVVEVYLRRLEQDNLRLATEVHARFKDSPAFGGWYLPQELDDVNWNGPRRNLIVDHVRALREGLRRIDPGRPVGISGFVNGFLDPAAYQEWLRELTAAAGIELFFLQDGVGVRKLSLEELPVYLGAAAKGVAQGGGTLRPVVEIFTQTHGEPMDKEPFQAEPADFSRVARQLAVAGRYAQQGITAFSLPEYALPSVGPLQAAFYRDYRQYLTTGR
ncbi:MAG: DUF4434 domain-containing protein [Desulfovibrio sp.]|nr:DUF4434 domain-containing protein [Desulfovibrio sp.]MBI4959482.1 DUF4434 domain-containing protein [Desulfovibrio sp.]